MFLINLSYKVELALVDQHLPAHLIYLEEQYAANNFVLSGRKQPRTGGIILSPLTDKAALLRILAKDPFHAQGLADYEIIEFIPSKASAALVALLP